MGIRDGPRHLRNVEGHRPDRLALARLKPCTVGFVAQALGLALVLCLGNSWTMFMAGTRDFSRVFSGEKRTRLRSSVPEMQPSYWLDTTLALCSRPSACALLSSKRYKMPEEQIMSSLWRLASKPRGPLCLRSLLVTATLFGLSVAAYGDTINTINSGNPGVLVIIETLLIFGSRRFYSVRNRQEKKKSGSQ